MIDMYNWLQDCCDEGSLDFDELQDKMKDDDWCMELWKEFVDDPSFSEYVRDQIIGFLKGKKLKS